MTKDQRYRILEECMVRQIFRLPKGSRISKDTAMGAKEEKKLLAKWREAKEKGDSVIQNAIAMELLWANAYVLLNVAKRYPFHSVGVKGTSSNTDEPHSFFDGDEDKALKTKVKQYAGEADHISVCLLYTSPSPRDS